MQMLSKNFTKRENMWQIISWIFSKWYITIITYLVFAFTVISLYVLFAKY
jgi:hypothetical protein